MTEWNFGIVGSGLIADFHAKAISELPNATLIGLCDSGSGRGKALAEGFKCRYFNDYKKLIDHPEVNIISIATPSGFHMEPALHAAKVGKHVLCEKPLEITVDRIDKMIAAHEKSGTYLGCIFPYRFNSSLQVIKDAIQAGRFGTISHAGIQVPWWRDENYYTDSWHGTWKLDGGGALMNQSIHMIDYLLYLMGPVNSVKAFASHDGHPKIETEDTATAILTFENGALGTIYGTTSAFPGQFRRLEIMGTQGTVVQVENSFTTWQFLDERPDDAHIRDAFGDIEGGGGVADPTNISYKNHTKNFEAFLEAIDHDVKFSIDGEEAKKSVALIRRIYKSAGIIK